MKIHFQNGIESREYYKNGRRAWQYKTLCGQWRTENGITSMHERITCPKCKAKNTTK